MKRTPASSHQCHCQRASVPMATKGRKREGEKEGGTASTIAPRKDKSGSARTKKITVCLSKCQQNQSTSNHFLDLESFASYFLLHFKVRPCCIFSLTREHHGERTPRSASETNRVPAALAACALVSIVLYLRWVDRCRRR